MPKFGKPTDEQLARINKLSKRELSADEVFVFSSKAAGDMLIPNRFTKIHKSLLEVFVDDANHGVSFMYNHNWSSFSAQGMPYGKVFGGSLLPSDTPGETTELHLERYIVRDDEVIDGISNNALIKRIETGVLSDTSIGFSTDKMVCSICGNNYYGGACQHYRGQEYKINDEGEKKLCYLIAMPPSTIIEGNNNALFEESIVWDGAYPTATITQSKHGDVVKTTSGEFSVIDDKEALSEGSTIINHYHNGKIISMVKKLDHKEVLQETDIEDVQEEVLRGDERMFDEKVLALFSKYEIEHNEDSIADDLLTQLATKLADAEVKIETQSQEDDNSIKLSQEIIKEKFGEGVDADKLLALAAEGVAYREDVIKDALAMGVRAMANEFDEDTWKSTFAKMETVEVKKMLASFEKQAKAEIPSGRKTNPEAFDKKVQFSAPDHLYKV